MTTLLSPSELTGSARTHVVAWEPLSCTMHPRALAAFLDLRAAAERAGFDLQPLSSFRDLQTQLRIWNQKFRGERPLYDEHGVEIQRAALSDWDATCTILGWSALPGASRHHWGSDVDIYDGARVAGRGAVRLLPEETAPGGVFHELYLWLNQEMARYGFFRPYDVYRGGIHPEPWHLSFAEVSVPALTALTADVLDAALAALAMDGKGLVRSRLAELHSRYVTNVADFASGDTLPIS